MAQLTMLVVEAGASIMPALSHMLTARSEQASGTSTHVLTAALAAGVFASPPPPPWGGPVLTSSGSPDAVRAASAVRRTPPNHQAGSDEPIAAATMRHIVKGLSKVSPLLARVSNTALTARMATVPANTVATHMPCRPARTIVLSCVFPKKKN
jgi:hypothetical protein